jgi:actin-related protein 3
VLSGGSTMFKGFDKRLQRDIKRVVDQRIRMSEEISGGAMKVRKNQNMIKGVNSWVFAL